MLIHAEITPRITWRDKKDEYENLMMHVEPQEVVRFEKELARTRFFFEQNGSIVIPLPNGEIIKIHF